MGAGWWGRTCNLLFGQQPVNTDCQERKCFLARKTGEHSLYSIVSLVFCVHPSPSHKRLVAFNEYCQCSSFITELMPSLWILHSCNSYKITFMPLFSKEHHSFTDALRKSMLMKCPFELFIFEVISNQ